MRDEQLVLLEKFRELYANPTYKEMTSITGLQLTRVFRLYNGFEMKLSEYLCFKKLVDEKIKEYSNIQFVFNECLEKLSMNTLVSIETTCVRYLETHNLLNEVKPQVTVA